MKNRLFSLAGALALLAVLGKFYAVPVMAQVKSALVKNVDERGRSPYQQSGFVQCTVGNSFCDLSLGAVPANKRLVVEHVSANIYAPGGINTTLLLVGGNTSNVFAGRANSLSSLLAVNEGALLYFEAGAAPVYRVVPSVADGNTAFSATVTGYVVDLTQ